MDPEKLSTIIQVVRRKIFKPKEKADLLMIGKKLMKSSNLEHPYKWVTNCWRISRTKSIYQKHWTYTDGIISEIKKNNQIPLLSGGTLVGDYFWLFLFIFLLIIKILMRSVKKIIKEKGERIFMMIYCRMSSK